MKRKNNILTIMKKELRRIFGDRRMLLAMLLPGLLIYVLYSVMGETMMKDLLPSDDDRYSVAVTDMPASIGALFEAAELPFDIYTPRGDEKEAVAAGELDLYVVFPADFDATVPVYDPASGKPAPEVQIYYNSSSTSSSTAFQMISAVLDGYESSLANRFDINRATEDATYDLATPEDMTGMLMSMLMPMLLTMLLFSGCMSVAPESIAGEKERGTLATLLVTPLRRSELAIGKIMALSIAAMIGGTWSFLAVMLSLPKLLGGEEAGIASVLDTGIYGVTDYLWLFGVIITTTLVFISAISVLSALARSVKEAAGMVSPLMILVVLVSMGGMIFPGIQGSTWAYLIPLYNSSQCISGIFSLSYEPVQILLTLLSNLLLTTGLVLLLTRLFNSEKVMFKR